MDISRKKLKKVYFKVLNSLIFYPALILLIFFFCSSVLLSYEDLDFGKRMKENVPYLYLQDTDTARTILTTLVASIISLMVFSFSMVMVVLGQAMTNFTPRLLPQLISDKKRQIVLGFYGGTLIHCTLVLISLGSKNPSKNSIGFSTMIAAILGIICVLLFIYFIQNISSIVRIDIIVKDIFNKTDQLLKKELKKEVYDKEENFSNWTAIKSNRTGYFKGFDESLLNNYFKESNNCIYVVPFEYKHVWEGDTVLWVQENIPDSESDNLLLCMTIVEDRYKGESFTSNLIKLMEVAVKAMSPGINDPGTATDVLHKLGRLLTLALRLPASSYDYSDNSSLEIVQANITTEQLMRLVIQPIRNYSKNDSYVMGEIIKTLQHLIKNEAIESSRLEGVLEELKSLMEDVDEYVENDRDKEKLLSFVSDKYLDK